MLTRALLLSALLALATGCPARGGGNGGDDDDDPGSGSSTAWLVVTSEDSEGEVYVEQDLLWVNFAGACSEMRDQERVLKQMDDAWNAGYDDVIDEFGDDESPGAQEAVCELDRDYYATFLDANLRAFQPGGELLQISLYDLDDEPPADLPPGGYLHGDDAVEEAYFYGGRQEATSLDWFRSWDDLDCSDPEDYDAMFDDIEYARFYELERGTIWISAPADNTRGAEAEGVVLVDGDSETESDFTLDDEFVRCEIDTRDF